MVRNVSAQNKVVVRSHHHVFSMERPPSGQQASIVTTIVPKLISKNIGGLKLGLHLYVHEICTSTDQINNTKCSYFKTVT